METEKYDTSGHVARTAAMRLITKSWSQSFALRNYFQDLGADWKMILNRIIKVQLEVVEWIYLTKQRNQVQAPVNTVINIRSS